MSGSPAHLQRRLPVGAEVQHGGGVHFRLWVPASQQVGVLFLPKDYLADATELALPKLADLGITLIEMMPVVMAGVRMECASLP